MRERGVNFPKSKGWVLCFFMTVLLAALTLLACGDDERPPAPPHLFTPPMTARPEGCPPGDVPAGQQPESPEDADIDQDGKKDLFLGRHHWAGYYDLTVEIWCMGGTHFSVRIWESVNGFDHLKVWPHKPESEGFGGPTDSGQCCPYVNGRNRPDAVYDPPLKVGETPKSPPVLIDWISRNPHAPGDHKPLEEYQKTIIWTQVKFNKTIKGQIKMVKNLGPPVTYSFECSGEFVVSSSPLQDGSKTAKEVADPANKDSEKDQKEILELFKKEKALVDADNPDLPPIPWPADPKCTPK